MRGINRVTLMGNLGSTPELLVSKNGKNFTKLNLAVTRRRRSSETGEYEDKTDWHRVVVWGTHAQNCCSYLERGSAVAIEGSLSQMKTTDSSKGTESIQTFVTADEVHFLPRRKESSALTQSVQ